MLGESVGRNASVGMCVLGLLLILPAGCSTGEPAQDAVLLSENFSGLQPGLFSAPVGPHTEYHYLPEAAPRGQWAVSCFTWEKGSQSAWTVEEEEGAHRLVQTFDNQEFDHTHPMVISGDEFWGDYTLSVRFSPQSDRDQSGIVFHYRNDRQYYFF